VTVQQLFHILARDEWASVPPDGHYRPESLTSDGFVHFSYRHQVAGTLALVLAGRSDLVVLEVDPAMIAAPVVVEDLYGHGQAFPHVYGPVPAAAVVFVHEPETFG